MENNNSVSYSLFDEEWLVFQQSGLPVFIYLIILCVFGVPGNMLVLIVYKQEYKKEAKVFNLMVLCLAFIDLLACVFCLPSTLYMESHPFTMNSTAFCKISRAVQYFTGGTSLCILDLIALERCLSICFFQKFKMSLQLARRLCIAVVILTCFVLLIPSLVSIEIVAIQTPYHNLTGMDCTYRGGYQNHVAFKAYGVIIFAFFTCMIIFCTTMYVLIFRELRFIKFWHKHYDKENVNNTENNSACFRTEDTEMTIITTKKLDEAKLDKTTKNKNKNLPQDNKKLKETKGDKRIRRKVVIFLVVSLISFGSYLPFLIAFMTNAVTKGLYEAYYYDYRGLYLFLAWGIYLNNVVNPIVYGFLNVDFRRKAWKLLKHIKVCHQ